MESSPEAAPRPGAKAAPAGRPLPHPCSNGSSCHGKPVRRTKTMPANTWRLLTRGRAPFGQGPRSRGRIGATTAHNASSTRGFISHRRFVLTL